LLVSVVHCSSFCAFLLYFSFSLLFPLPPSPPLFPYTTLFRSPDRAAVRPRSRGDPAALRRRHAQLPVPGPARGGRGDAAQPVHVDRKSTRLNSSHVKISYAVFCLKKKTYTVCVGVNIDQNSDR